MAYKPAYIWNGTSWDQIGNQAVASLDDYALLNPSASANQTITNTTLTAPNITSASVVGGTIESSSVIYPVFISPEERTTISASAASASVQFDALTQGVLYYSASATGNWTMNFRGNSATTLNSIMETGDSITLSFLATQGATAYYPTTFAIDGSAVTPKWSGGSAPSSGNTNSIDAYSFTIVKTASATFTVFAGAVRFA
jgi:hypothetical protein